MSTVFCTSTRLQTVIIKKKFLVSRSLEVTESADAGRRIQRWVRLETHICTVATEEVLRAVVNFEEQRKYVHFILLIIV